MMRSSSPLLVCLVAATAACFGGARRARAEAASDLHFQSAPAAGTKLLVRNIVGDITVEAASGTSLDVVGTKVGAPEDTARITLVAKVEGDTVLVCALWPGEDASACRGEGGRGIGARSSPQSTRHARADFHLRVPPQIANLRVGTVEGAIAVTGVQANVDAASVDGTVAVQGSGAISAATVNGRVSALAVAGAPVSLASTQGGVTLTLPATAAADVDASTINGHISSDFGAVPGPSFPGMHSARFRVGAGGTAVKLTTVNGDVHLARG